MILVQRDSWYDLYHAEVTRLAVALPLVVATDTEPCCHPVSRCDYRPQRIANYLRWIDSLAQSGYTPSEALQSVLSVGAPDHDASCGPGVPNGARIVADLQRAFKAGKRNPQEISRFLCPWSETCED